MNYKKTKIIKFEMQDTSAYLYTLSLEPDLKHSTGFSIEMKPEDVKQDHHQISDYNCFLFEMLQ